MYMNKAYSKAHMYFLFDKYCKVLVTKYIIIQRSFLQLLHLLYMS